MSNNDQQRLVLFDFDGTLTRHDSLFAFLRFFKGNMYFVYKLILALPGLVSYKLGLVDNSTAKEKLLSKFLKGMTVDEFESRCRKFSQEILPKLLNQRIFEKFQGHIVKGDRVVIISASIEDWILPWAKQWNVEVLATKLAARSGRLTGKFDGSNCNGKEKVKRIKAHIKITDYDEIWAYGDSSGDEPMLNLATQVVYRGKVRN